MGPSPPEDDGAEEGEPVEGPDGKTEEVDQGPHVPAEHEHDRERALRGSEIRNYSVMIFHSMS